MSNRRSSVIILSTIVLIAAAAPHGVLRAGQSMPLSGIDRYDVLPFSLEAQHFDGVVVQLQPNSDQVEALVSKDRIRLHHLPLGDGLSVTLDLRRFEVFTPDARIVRGTPHGDEPIARPDVVLFGGRVVGRARSSAFLSISPGQTQGWVTIDHETYILSSGPREQQGGLVAYSPSRLPEGAIQTLPFTCETDQLQHPPLLGGVVGEGAAPRDADPWPSACRRASLAIDTDYEYTGVVFEGDTEAAAAYAATLIGAVSEIFKRDFNTVLQISYLRLWDQQEDLWDQETTLNQLLQFRAYWNDEMTAIERNAVHFLSGRPLGGGVAYLPGLCYPEYDYGLSANLNGYFPYPIEHNHAQNWDLLVVAHELGHNFGAPHTHNMSPPVDQCASGDCSVTPNGTIMGYCHLCPGGMVNVRMELGQRVVKETILPIHTQPWFCDLVVDCDPIGDCNGDGVLDLSDLDCFVDVALGLNSYNGPMQRSDLFNDGEVNGLDIEPFVAALLSL